MERIGNQNVTSYFDEHPKSRSTSNSAIRRGSGHEVKSYFDLAMKVAELHFLNREHVLLFRGQRRDYRTIKNNSMLKPSIFRLDGRKVPSLTLSKNRFDKLRGAEDALSVAYSSQKLLGFDRLKRHRIIRWAILQHYGVCDTPLLDVTHSPRIAASFASSNNYTDEAYVFVFGVPNLSGAVTASSEAGLQTIRLSSACPPAAVRPHIQEGYLLCEYPEISDYSQNVNYRYYEMDFGRRLVAKFRFNPNTFWSSENYPRATDAALYPAGHRDPLLEIANELKDKFEKEIG